MVRSKSQVRPTLPGGHFTKLWTSGDLRVSINYIILWSSNKNSSCYPLFLVIRARVLFSTPSPGETLNDFVVPVDSLSGTRTYGFLTSYMLVTFTLELCPVILNPKPMLFATHLFISGVYQVLKVTQVLPSLSYWTLCPLRSKTLFMSLLSCNARRASWVLPAQSRDSKAWWKIKKFLKFFSDSWTEYYFLLLFKFCLLTLYQPFLNINTVRKF